MKEQSSVLPLPPLSVKALNDLQEIEASGVGSLLGLFPLFASGEQYRGILLHTAAEHIKTRPLNFPEPKHELPSANEPPPPPPPAPKK